MMDAASPELAQTPVVPALQKSSIDAWERSLRRQQEERGAAKRQTELENTPRWKAWVSKYPWLGVTGGAIGAAGLIGSVYALNRLRVAILEAIFSSPDVTAEVPPEVYRIGIDPSAIQALKPSVIEIQTPAQRPSPELIEATRKTVTETLGEWYEKVKAATAAPLVGDTTTPLTPVALGALAGGVAGTGVLLAGNLLRRDEKDDAARYRRRAISSSSLYRRHPSPRQYQYAAPYMIDTPSPQRRQQTQRQSIDTTSNPLLLSDNFNTLAPAQRRKKSSRKRASSLHSKRTTRQRHRTTPRPTSR